MGPGRGPMQSMAVCHHALRSGKSSSPTLRFRNQTREGQPQARSHTARDTPPPLNPPGRGEQDRGDSKTCRESRSLRPAMQVPSVPVDEKESTGEPGDPKLGQSTLRGIRFPGDHGRRGLAKPDGKSTQCLATAISRSCYEPLSWGSVCVTQAQTLPHEPQTPPCGGGEASLPSLPSSSKEGGTRLAKFIK